MRCPDSTERTRESIRRPANGVVAWLSASVALRRALHKSWRSGAEFLAEADEDEEDQLDDAWGLDAQSRLACCVKLRDTDLVIELPRHTRNHAREK